MDPSLYTAATEGKPEDLKHYTNRFALQFTKNNNTVLHVIAAFGHSHCVTEILDASPLLLRRENTHGDTPLHMAAAGGHDDVVEWLIDSAKELNKTASANDAVRRVSGSEGNELFQTAAANDGISGGGEGNEPNTTATTNDGVGGSIVSGGGSEGGVSPAVREMLKARNRDGDTPLHLAARFRHPLPVVSLLTNADRELYYGPNKAGETPLYLVVDRGSDVAAVSEILKNCKSPAFRGPDGRTAMHAAAIDSSKDAILNKLLEWKQDLIKERDAKGWTPLHFAAHNGNLEAVKKLLDKDKSVAYANNDEGNTALHVATIRGDVSVMDELLSKLPDCWEMENSKGKNILHIAADRERDAATHFILEKSWVNRLINQKDNEGNTPVHVLASKGKDGLQMCPEADMRVLNHETLTPLDILHRKIAAKGRSIYKMSVNLETRRSKDDHYVLKIGVENLAEMEERIESLLTEGFTAQFEQLRSQTYMESRGSETRKLPDATSGRRTIGESIGDDNGEQSRRMPTGSPGPNEQESRERIEGGKPDDKRNENKQSEYDLNLKGREMKQTNKDKHISNGENVKKLFTNNYNLSSLITEKDTDFLDTIDEWKNGDKNAIIWSSGYHACIFLEDFLSLLQEGDVGNTLIDGYTFLLEKLQKEDSNSLFFTSTCWSLIHFDKTDRIDKELEQLDNKLQQKKRYDFRYLVFPMNSTGNRDKDGTPYHWTLLVFDIQDKEWRHFNSKKPRDQGSQDPYKADALIVKTYVEEYMANMHGKKQGPHRTLFQGQDLNTTISSVEKAPQQPENSLDCGIIVCYIAKQFANGDEIPTSMTTDEIRAFRVELFHTFMDEIKRSSKTDRDVAMKKSEQEMEKRTMEIQHPIEQYVTII